MSSVSPPREGVWQVYGSRLSYYTGKLEVYLRLRGISYEILPVGGNQKRLIAATGTSQMPVVRMADGRWMTDTTPMLAWLDQGRADGPSIYPENPTLRFVALLIEDYADEWLWRSAMHYRWLYRLDRRYAAQALYEEQVRGQLPMPRFWGTAYLTARQLGGFVRGDGIDARSRAHAVSTYLSSLECLEAILAQRPFLLGERPTIADFGMMAPMFRHFGQDPTPAEIMRTRAPRVYEWVARMWNLNPASKQGELIAAIDAPLARFLAEIGATHLAQLRQNAAAYTQTRERYDLEVQQTLYRRVPTSRYRVWCLEQLRKAWTGLPDDAQSRLRATLTAPDAAIVWDAITFRASDYDRADEAPFNRAINVFAGGVPGRKANARQGDAVS